MADISLAPQWILARSSHADWAVWRNREQDEFLMYKGKLVVPSSLVPTILAEYYDAKGHFGVDRTLQMVQQQFWWRQQRQPVSDYVARCEACQR